MLGFRLLGKQHQVCTRALVDPEDEPIRQSKVGHPQQLSFFVEI